MGKMMDKYNATLTHIIGLPRDNQGLFTIDYKDSTKELGLTVNTMNRHIKKFIAQGKLHLVYKGGSSLVHVCKDIIMDADKFNDGYWESRRNPNNFLSTVYTLKPITQLQRDTAILRSVLRWQEKHIAHYLWWCNADSLEYDVNANGLSLKTLNLLRQYVKYMVKPKFGYSFSGEEYDDVYDKYCELSEMHTVFSNKHSIHAPLQDIA